MVKKLRRLFIATLLLWAYFTGGSLSVMAQQSLEQRMTLSLDNQTLLQAIKAIETRSTIRFSYAADVLQKYDRRVTLKARDLPLRDILEQIFSRSPLTYKIADSRIVLQPNPAYKPRKPITGRVVDARTGAPMLGVTVKLKNGTAGVMTDENGYFTLPAQDDNVIIIFSHLGYDTQELGWEEGLVIGLRQKVRTLGEVQVQARRRTNTELAILNDRRNAAIVQDGISAANIEKTASITTTQALQRVTGVTITDDKYVAIRGLGDRSVIAELNGARLSSSDPDRSAVPLDLVPAGLLDNITVYKTITPDKPADASAGIIELKTKSVPDSQVLQFTSQVGVNSSIGLGGSYNSFRGSDPGFWGEKVKKHELTPAFNKLQQQYPGGLPQIQELFIQSRNNPALADEAFRINRIMQGFDPVLTTSHRPAVLNQIYTVSFGNSYNILHGHKLGVVLSANYYRRTEDRYNGELNQYSIYQGVLTGSDKIFSPLHIPNFITPDKPRLGKYIGYKENSGITTLNYGVLGGLTYRINTRNEVQFQYVGSRGAEVQGSDLSGAWQNTGLQFPVYNQVYQLRQSYRVFNTYNFQGEHRLLDRSWSPQISYNLSNSRSVQNEPDFRFTDVADYRKTAFVNPDGVGIVSDQYSFVVGSAHGVGPNDVVAADPNGRKYRKLTEDNYNAKVDLSQPFFVRGNKQVLKFGYNYLRRNRDFSENILGLPGTTIGGDNGLLNKVQGDLDELVSYRNIGLKDPAGYDNAGQPRVGGFLYQIKKSPNNYEGRYETQAFYGMLDAHIGENWRFAGGVRFEYTDIRAHVDTSNVYNPLSTNPLLAGQGLNASTTQPDTRYKADFKPYYSANLTYVFRKNMNFRLAYSTTLARPELRELTNIYEFDPFQFAVVIGNPGLKNQLARSLDFRWEWFPHPGEVFALSLFGKEIENQLNKVFIYHPQGTKALFPEVPVIVYQNDPNKGHLVGIELEARKDLGRIWPGLRYFSLGTNIMIASSSITKNAERLDAARAIDRHAPDKSPLFEQAPYSVNAFLDYSNSRLGTSFTVNFNVVGERLIQVQLDGTPDLYSRPAPMLDVVLSQVAFKRFVIKAFAKNLLNPAFREVYTNPGQNGLYHNVRYIHHQYYRGTEYSLGLTYNLF